MQEKEFHDFIHRLLAALEIEENEMTKTALTALYELTRLALYVKKFDKVGYGEKVIYAAASFERLVASIENNLNVPPGAVQKRLGK